MNERVLPIVAAKKSMAREVGVHGAGHAGVDGGDCSVWRADEALVAALDECPADDGALGVDRVGVAAVAEAEVRDLIDAEANGSLVGFVRQRGGARCADDVGGVGRDSQA